MPAAAKCRSTSPFCAPRTFRCCATRGPSTWALPAATWWPRAARKLASRLDLGVGECRLAVCVPDDSPITTPAELDGCRIATSFPHVTETFLKGHDATAHLVEPLRLGRDHDRPGRGRRDRRPGGDRQHAGGQSAAHPVRDRPLPDRAGAEPGQSARRTCRPGGAAARRRGDRPQLFAAGVQRAPRKTVRRPKRSRRASTRRRSAPWKIPTGAPSG